MPVTINGNGSITGLSVGGLPNGTVDADTLASNAVTSSKIADSSVITSKIASGGVAASTLPAGTIVQTVFKNGESSTSSVQLNSGSMGNPSWFDTSGSGSSMAEITPIFANSKILVNFMYSLRLADGNRLGVMAYVSMASNMSNLARISDYRGTTGNESYRNATGGTDWHSHSLFAVDDGSYQNSIGNTLSMSTATRYYNIGYYHASGDGANYYGDHSQRIFIILQEIKQ